VNSQAAIQLKVMVEYHWKFRNEEHAKKIALEGFDFILISEEEKKYIRGQIVGSIDQCQNRLVKKQLLACLKVMARFDYPELWGELLTEISSYLNKQDENHVMTGLYALKAVCKKFEFEIDKGRDPLIQIIEQCFPYLGQLVNTLIQTTHPLGQQMLYQIGKIFYIAN